MSAFKSLSFDQFVGQKLLNGSLTLSELIQLQSTPLKSASLIMEWIKKRDSKNALLEAVMLLKPTLSLEQRRSLTTEYFFSRVVRQFQIVAAMEHQLWKKSVLVTLSS